MKFEYVSFFDIHFRHFIKSEQFGSIKHPTTSHKIWACLLCLEYQIRARVLSKRSMNMWSAFSTCYKIRQFLLHQTMHEYELIKVRFEHVIKIRVVSRPSNNEWIQTPNWICQNCLSNLCFTKQREQSFVKALSQHIIRPSKMTSKPMPHSIHFLWSIIASS